MDKKTRVLVCAYTCSPTAEGESFGGGEDILGWNLVCQLARFNEIWVLAHARNRPSVDQFLTTHNQNDIHVCYLDLPQCLEWLRRIQGGVQCYAFIWQIWAYFEAKRLHRMHRFQIFHHVTYANDWMASYIGALLPVFYIRGPGGGAHKTPKSFLSEYTVQGRIWEKIRSIGQWLFRHDPFFVIGQSRSRAILLCNREAMDAVPEKWRHKAHMFSVCGVNNDDLALTTLQKSGCANFTVLAAGKLLRIKGFSLAIRAFSMFVQRNPGVRMKIVGEGPELHILKDLAIKLGIQGSIQFQPWMPREDLLKEMAVSDAFIFPGLRDGGGAVVVEAMAMGTPVVCLDISGPGMHVNEDTGFKVKATNPSSAIIDMAQALETIYKDGELRYKMGLKAKEHVVSQYHWDRTGDRLQVIYKDILQ